MSRQQTAAPTSRHDVTNLAANLDLESLRKQSAPTNKIARVKIEKGHAWLIRLLPFPQGPKKSSFAHLAQHWIGGRSVMCKQKTDAAFGGDPSYDCPICQAAASGKNEATTDADRDDFYDVEARESFRCYCLVFRRQDDRGRIEEVEGDDIYIAHEFNIPKSSFSTLLTKIERSCSRQGASAYGLLDLEKGCDIWAARDSKNSLTFDLSEDGPQPIFPLDDNFDAQVDRVWKNLKQPSVKFMPEERENALADMIAEKNFDKAGKMASEREERSARGNGHSGRGQERGGGGARGRFHEAPAEEAPARGRGRFSGVQDEGQEAPAPRTRNNAFTRAQAALGNDDPQDGAQDGAQPEGAEEDQLQGAEVPARRGGGRPMAEPAQEPEQEQEQAPAVSTRRGGSAVRQAPARVTVPPAVAAGRRAGAPPPPPPARGEGGRVEAEDEGQGGDNVPEEQRDPAPAEPAATEPAQEPTTARTASPSRMSSAIRGSVARLASAGR